MGCKSPSRWRGALTRQGSEDFAAFNRGAALAKRPIAREAAPNRLVFYMARLAGVFMYFLSNPAEGALVNPGSVNGRARAQFSTEFRAGAP